MFNEDDAVVSAAKNIARDRLEDDGFKDEFKDAVVPAAETGAAEMEAGMMVLLIVNVGP